MKTDWCPAMSDSSPRKLLEARQHYKLTTAFKLSEMFGQPAVPKENAEQCTTVR